MATKAAPKKSKKERGKVLTILLAWHSLAASIFMFIFLFYTLFQIISTPHLGFILTIPLFLCFVFSAIGIWKWKKWGAYLALVIVGTVLLSYILRGAPQRLEESLGFWLFSGAYFWAIRRKWQYFS